MLLKNLPSSRKLVTFDTKRKYVQAFQMISDNLILAQVVPDQVAIIDRKSRLRFTGTNSYLSGQKHPYWVLMNTRGEVQSIPAEMEEVF